MLFLLISRDILKYFIDLCSELVDDEAFMNDQHFKLQNLSYRVHGDFFTHISALT
jgi:hypothetical protein